MLYFRDVFSFLSRKLDHVSYRGGGGGGGGGASIVISVDISAQVTQAHFSHSL